MIQIVNWTKYQIVNSRGNPRPAWIKLHVALLDHIEYRQLTYLARALLIDLWLLAAPTGEIEKDDPAELAFRLRYDNEGDVADGLAELKAAGLIEILVSKRKISSERLSGYRKRKRSRRRTVSHQSLTGDSHVEHPEKADSTLENSVSHQCPTGDSHVSHIGESGPTFDNFWEIYPPRTPNSKATARRNWEDRVAEGVSPYQLMAAVTRYRKYVDATRTPNEFILLAASFLGPKRRGYEDDWKVPEDALAPPEVIGYHDE